MSKVLVVDDQEAVRTALQLLFELNGLEVITVGSASAALDAIRTADVGLVIQDMNFSHNITSGEEGTRLFREIRLLDPDLPVVMLTAWTSLQSAVELVKLGAADYLAKPWDDQRLLLTAKNLLRLRTLGQENARLRGQAQRERRELERQSDLRGLVYQSSAMHQVVSLAVQVARSDVPVLITGPNGSGKEKIADIIHAGSRRAKAPLVKVNVGALPEQLLEAELFGAEAGAFTGATKLRIGRFEAADGGTLFLDELGNLSLPGQMKLLRVLQNGEFERVGSSTTRQVDVRIVSATNADLRVAIANGSFREDLFFRLNVIELRVPPLCERIDDILPLAEHFLAQKGGGGGVELSLSPEACASLEAYDWPGNVRELENRVQRAALVCRDGRITPSDLDLTTRLRESHASGVAAAAARRDLDPLSHAERQVVEEALTRARGVVSRAAAELGLSRQALYRRMERLGIEIERRTKA